jgi:hypothetical protein
MGQIIVLPFEICKTTNNPLYCKPTVSLVFTCKKEKEPDPLKPKLYVLAKKRKDSPFN